MLTDRKKNFKNILSQQKLSSTKIDKIISENRVKPQRLPIS